jgi:DNA-binding response OmpR family regulator
MMLTTEDDEPTGRFHAATDDDPPLVVLAEDDDEMRHLIARKLRRAGYDVVEARNGAELALVIEDGRLGGTLRDDGRAIELIVSDIRMPGITGLEVVQLVRGTDWSVPIILITAFGDRETHSEAMRLGAVLLDKPLDLDELVFAARRLVVQ